MSIKFKVGDRMLVENRYRQYLTNIESVTKGGNFKDGKGLVFTPSGRERSSDIWNRMSVRLVLPAEEAALRDEWRRRKLIRECAAILYNEEPAIDVKDITLDVIKQVHELLQTLKGE